MTIKTNWNNYLHAIRKREVDLLIQSLARKNFSKGFELGAGDGYQTTLLAPLCKEFLSSDLNFSRLKDQYRLPHVEYKKIDADNLHGIFPEKTFDFIFSSNMLEHLSNRESFLIETHHLLTSDGYAVHVVPSRGVKISYIFLFYLNFLFLVLDRLWGFFKGKKIFQGKENNFENNINSSDKKSWFKKIFSPSIHGNY